MFCLIKSYVAKENGNQDTEYETKVLNFFLDKPDNDKRDFGFVSKYIYSIYLRDLNCLSSANREMPFIFHDKNDIIDIVGKKVAKIRNYFGDKSIHVDMSLGFDTTISVRGWQILRSHNKIIGGASPNHYLYIGKKSKEDMVEFLKLYPDANKGVLSSEVKVSIVSFHKKTPGIFPYFSVASLPRKINEKNDLGIRNTQ